MCRHYKSKMGLIDLEIKVIDYEFFCFMIGNGKLATLFCDRSCYILYAYCHNFCDKYMYYISLQSVKKRGLTLSYIAARQPVCWSETECKTDRLSHQVSELTWIFKNLTYFVGFIFLQPTTRRAQNQTLMPKNPVLNQTGNTRENNSNLKWV